MLFTSFSQYFRIILAYNFIKKFILLYCFNWFSIMGVESYRIRASSHYYQYQLKTILEKVKPRKGIKMIHTEKPKIFLKALKEITEHLE